MSAEVITMDEFKKDAAKSEDNWPKEGTPVSDEEVQSWHEWGQRHSLDLLRCADTPFQILTLIENLAEALLISGDESSEDCIASVKEALRAAVTRGIENFETPCPECGE